MLRNVRVAMWGVAVWALLGLGMGGGTASAQPQFEPTLPAPTRSRELPKFFGDLEKRTFDYFWETTNPANGLVPDRYPYDEPFASIAAMGFGLTAYPIASERGWITREQARERVLTTLRFLHDAPQGDAQTGMTGHHGFFYHFLELQTGHRYQAWVELSTVDTALLLGGVLFAQTWFDRDEADDAEIRRLAEAIYRRVDWPWMQQRGALISMGWYPERGFIEHDWRGYNEAMLVYLLALGSPTHPVGPEAWQEWTSTYNESWSNFQGQTHLGFGPMFGHQYSQVWVDFRGIRDAYMRDRNSDYFINSRKATLAQRSYAIENPLDFKSYGKNVWGLTASDGPGHFVQQRDDGVRIFRGYSARGAGSKDAYDDGTIAPTAVVGSLPFAPEIVIPATRTLLDRYKEQIYGEYGFLDAFNRSFDYDVPLKYGKRIPGWGWVAHQYIGIDQGPILLMIQNHRNGRVWQVMRRNPHLRLGLERAGFSGGWLDAPVGTKMSRTGKVIGAPTRRATAPIRGQ